MLMNVSLSLMLHNNQKKHVMKSTMVAVVTEET